MADGYFGMGEGRYLDETIQAKRLQSAPALFLTSTYG